MLLVMNEIVMNEVMNENVSGNKRNWECCLEIYMKFCEELWKLTLERSTGLVGPLQEMISLYFKNNSGYYAETS